LKSIITLMNLTVCDKTSDGQQLSRNARHTLESSNFNELFDSPLLFEIE
jgi:hypothetical protein